MIPVIYSDKFLLHETGYMHPEQPERLIEIVNKLKASTVADEIEWIINFVSLKTMTAILKISFSCYLVTAIVSIAFGIIYLTRSEFMPYHAVALEREWTELDIKTQTLILALMRVAGGGFLATGMVVILLIYLYIKTTEEWIIFIIPTIGFVTSFSSLYATLLVKNRTPGLPPVNLTLLSIGLMVTGFILSLGA